MDYLALSSPPKSLCHAFCGPSHKLMFLKFDFFWVAMICFRLFVCLFVGLFVCLFFFQGWWGPERNA